MRTSAGRDCAGSGRTPGTSTGSWSLFDLAVELVFAQIVGGEQVAGPRASSKSKPQAVLDRPGLGDLLDFTLFGQGKDPRPEHRAVVLVGGRRLGVDEEYGLPFVTTCGVEGFEAEYTCEPFRTLILVPGRERDV